MKTKEKGYSIISLFVRGGYSHGIIFAWVPTPGNLQMGQLDGGCFFKNHYHLDAAVLSFWQHGGY